jgi:hypothetical protein
MAKGGNILKSCDPFTVSGLGNINSSGIISFSLNISSLSSKSPSGSTFIPNLPAASHISTNSAFHKSENVTLLSFKYFCNSFTDFLLKFASAILLN